MLVTGAEAEDRARLARLGGGRTAADLRGPRGAHGRADPGGRVANPSPPAGQRLARPAPPSRGVGAPARPAGPHAARHRRAAALRQHGARAVSLRRRRCGTGRCANRAGPAGPPDDRLGQPRSPAVSRSRSPGISPAASPPTRRWASRASPASEQRSSAWRPPPPPARCCGNFAMPGSAEPWNGAPDRASAGLPPCTSWRAKAEEAGVSFGDRFGRDRAPAPGAPPGTF